MQIIDLFSGIGGFSLAGSWMDWRTIQFCENNEFCKSKLKKHWPNIPIHDDIKTFTAEHIFNNNLYDSKETTIITGGFPCQPFSVAGKQKGKGDDRHLWPEMLRVIREVRPTWIVGENVPGIIRMELENICLALESEGYEVQPFIIPSASIGAWDKRERVWIIAYNHRLRCNNEQKENGQSLSNGIRINQAQEQNRGQQQCGIMQSNSIITDIQKQRIGKLPIQQRGQNETSNIDINREIKADLNSDFTGLQGHAWYEFTKRQQDEIRRGGQANWLRDWIEVASELCRSNARVPRRMDRIKALGNSVNPYAVYQLFKTIEQFNSQT